MGCYDAALCGTFAVSGVRRCNPCRGYSMLLVVYEYISVFSVWQDPYQHSTVHYKSMISSTLHLSSSLPYERATVGDYDPGVGRGHFGSVYP